MRPSLLIALGLGLGACAARSPSFPGPTGTLGMAERRGLPMSESVVATAPRPAAVAAPAAAAPEAPRKRAKGDASLVKAARFYLRHPTKGFRGDCSGFICAIYDRAGAPLSGNTRSLWAMARSMGVTHTRKIPNPGDLAFFDNTYDRDKDGRWDDELTHIGVVIEVEADGTVVLAHNGTSKGRTTLRLNLKHRDVHADDTGRVLNDYLRARSKRDPKKAQHLAGQLWRGWASMPAVSINE